MKEAQQIILTIGVTAASRILIWRDRLLGRIGRGRGLQAFPLGVSRHSIPSGGKVVDAVFVKPIAGDARASLLICHGIGETVEHWLPVQQLLAASGVASLVFDYTGFGRSSGVFQASQSEQGAVSAFLLLQELSPSKPISLLGFSLGSGIAIAILSRVSAHRLVLCAAFTSLRNGAISMALPKPLAFLVPPIWNSQDALRTCSIPVLVVHGEKDRLFPVRMAEDLKDACCSPTELVTIPGLSHNEPFYNPQLAYWGQIISRLV